MSIISAGTSNTTTLVYTGDTTGAMVFQTNGTTEAMRITTAQNVGIGTSSPSGRLHAQAATVTADILYATNSNNRGLNVNTNSSDHLQISHTNSNFNIDYWVSGTGIHTFSTSGSERMRIAADGSMQARSGNEFRAYRSDNVRYGSFLTNNDGTVLSSFNGNGEPLLLIAPTGYVTVSTNGAERMRIATDGGVSAGSTTGTVGLGIWSNFGSRIVDFARYADDGAIVGFRRGTTLVGRIDVTASATAYVTSSDYRLKENIAPMTGALAKVQQLKPVTYNWKVDGSDGQGFIAHELAEVVPDAVSGTKDEVDADGNPAYQGVDTSFLVATLTAAIQEQQAQIEELKAEVAALKGNN